MNRIVVLDTETTGLSPKSGHRIIEIGCVEIINRQITQRQFHYYLQPDRLIDNGAFKVHGITNESLINKPKFVSVAREFIDFIRNSEVVIHNASFDTGFIDAELSLLGEQWQTLSHYCKITDSLKLARKLHPNEKNSLDALCQRYNIDNANRQVHGALLDAQLLSKVYLSMTLFDNN